MPGPCLNHVWPSITLRPARTMSFWGLNKCDLKHLSIECPFFQSCPGHFWPCWDHVYPDLICRPPTDLKFSGLSHYDLRLVSMEWLLFYTTSIPFLDPANHAYPSSLPDRIKHLNFVDWSLFGTMSGQCFYHVETAFGLWVVLQVQ